MVRSLTGLSLGLVALGMAACTPAEEAQPAETRTVVQTREVPVVVQQPTAVKLETQPPAVVVGRDGDTTQLRAGRDGVEVETTNR